MLRPRSIALLLALATLVIYLPVTRNGFVNYDDDDYVTNNPMVKAGLTAEGIKWAFVTGHASNWHPLTWISHMTDCELFNLNPAAHHFVSALFHAANAALLFILLVRLTVKIWPAAMVAALFAWHPLHVESVAWVAERKDVLCAFFWLLTLLAYVKFCELSKTQSPGSKVFYGATLLAFACALMAKPMAVTLPFILLLLDFWPLKRIPYSALRTPHFFPLLVEKIPFLALTIISCALTYWAQHGGNSVVSLGDISLSFRLKNAPVAVAGYVCKLFWPANLAVLYPLRHIAVMQLVVSLMLLLLISFLAWRWRMTRPYFLMGWLWFLGTLVPVIGIVQVGAQSMADRYTYIPSIGFFLVLVLLAADVAEKIRMPRTILAALAVLICAACVFATERQIRFWQDGETLFRRAVTVTANNDVAHVNLGVALDLQGQTEAALDEYRAAERINPDRYQIHYNLGVMLDKAGHPQAALDEYLEAIKLNPEVAALHTAAGGAMAALGNVAGALKEFAGAERLDPHDASPHVQTAKVLFGQGRDADGVEELRAALRAEPDNFQILAIAAHYLAANENAAARDGKNALILALKANGLSGQQPFVFDILGMAFAANGDFTNAVTCAQNALDLATAAQMKGTGQLQQRLDLYKKNQPWRESFLATNTPPKN
ncbi:MAG TPA: tetratricopeptide repeat protein [Candidatus Sulfotelmatobacter sp.]|nr:tetratricopeptide repeat protein [Candidatus Sulfotelmatobacter sp.]